MSFNLGKALAPLIGSFIVLAAAAAVVDSARNYEQKDGQLTNRGKIMFGLGIPAIIASSLYILWLIKNMFKTDGNMNAELESAVRANNAAIKFNNAAVNAAIQANNAALKAAKVAAGN